MRPHFVVRTNSWRVLVNCGGDDVHDFLLLFLIQRRLLRNRRKHRREPGTERSFEKHFHGKALDIG